MEARPIAADTARLLDILKDLMATEPSLERSNNLWSAASNALVSYYGFSLFTVLSFASPTGVERVYTTRSELHPRGKREPRLGVSGSVATPPKRDQWQQCLLVEGKPWIGSVKADLRDVFEDWELLWENELGSVMNVPLRLEGRTIGSLNMLDGEHAYDGVDLGVVEQVADLVAPELMVRYRAA